MATSNVLGLPVLSLAVFLPAFGAVFAALCGPRRGRLAARVGLLCAGASLLLATMLLATYDADWLVYPPRPAFQFADPAAGAWRGLPGGLAWQIGLDGIAVVFVFVVSLVAFFSLLPLARDDHRRFDSLHRIVASALWLQCGLLGAFASLDVALFFCFWLVSIVAEGLLVGPAAGSDRAGATRTFAVAASAASALLGAAVYALVRWTGGGGSHLFDVLARPTLGRWAQIVVFALFAFAFAVRMALPLFLAWRHGAPAGPASDGSTLSSRGAFALGGPVVLSRASLALGGYGFLRLALPFCPSASLVFAPVALGVSALASLAAAVAAYRAKTAERTIAASSLAGVGLASAALFGRNVHGLSGGVLYLVGHGLAAATLLLLFGMIADRVGPRHLAETSGLLATMPRCAALVLVAVLASFGLPGTVGFVGVWLALLGVFRADMAVGVVFVAAGMIGASALLRLYTRLFFGPTSHGAADLEDLGAGELAVVLPLVVLILAAGVWPSPVLGPIARTCQAWLAVISPGASPVPGP